MDEKPLYGLKDCICNGYDMFITGRVAVMRTEALPNGIGQRDSQLIFCTGGAGSHPNAPGDFVRAVSLFNREHIQIKRSEIIGLLKPELLSERASLNLSQVRPLDSEIPLEPLFVGYCFLPDGRYTAGVPLSDEVEVSQYLDIQREYQHKIMICDRDDFCVLEMMKGKLIYPTQEILDAHREQGSMELKL